MGKKTVICDWGQNFEQEEIKKKEIHNLLFVCGCSSEKCSLR